MSKVSKLTDVVYTCTIDTPLGPMTAAAEESFLTGLWFVGQKYYPDTAGWVTRKDHGVFKWLRPYLKCYFDGKVGNHDFPLAPTGHRLEQLVWQILGMLPYGRAVVPSVILRQVMQWHDTANVTLMEVDEAVARNPIAILIPSHRVLRLVGALDGYPGGRDRKEALLRIEGVLNSGTVLYREDTERQECHYAPLVIREG